MREIFGWKRILFILLCTCAAVGCGAASLRPTGVPPSTPTQPPPSTAVPANPPTALPTFTAAVETPTVTQVPAPSETPTTEATAAAPGNEMPTDALLLQFIAQARADLARRLGITAESFRLIDAKAVDWPDSSLGCPRPGFMYSQIVTAGYLIVLGANEKQYEYHADKRRVFLCEK